MKPITIATGIMLFFCVLNLSGTAGHAMPFAPTSCSATEAVENTGLVVQIDNVTDDQSSRRSSVELYVDGKKISPSIARKPGRRDYVFEIPLAPGIYKVKAVYRVKSFWKEKSFDLMTHDGHVRVYPEHRTFLTITLDKNSDGSLRDRKNYFTELTRPSAPAVARESKHNLSGDETVSTPPTSSTPEITQPPPAAERVPATATAPVVTTAPTASVPAMPRESSPAVVSQPAAPSPETTQPIPPRAGRIALQINTSPSSADVIVDDRYLGQSPVTTYIDRSRSHVVQISKTGYMEIMKIIDPRALGEENAYLMIEKLEAQK